jgi:dTDP-4-dehydrorhamnose reductase
MKFFVTGSSGLVGSQIVKDLLEKNHIVYSGYNEVKPEKGIPKKIDLTDFNEIKKVISEISPDNIIHLGAMTNVDQCELQPQIAKTINANATEILAKEASRLNAFFLYMSTDYVFDGKYGRRSEKDVPNPISHYGESKFLGELTLNKICSPYAIARTSTPFGFHNSKKSFPIWVKENLESKKEIPVIVDQFTSPTYVPNLSKMIIEIVTRQIVGTIHTAGATRISRFEFAEKIAEKLNLEKKFLKPVKISEMNWKAHRPQDSSLDVSFASEILNEKPQKIDQILDEFFKIR